MSKTICQIYGVLTVADAELCVELGAEFIGTVFREQAVFPHVMSPLQLKEFYDACPEGLTKVGLTHLDDIEDTLKLLDIYCPPVLHLIGDTENYITPDMILRIKAAHPEVRIMMAIAIDVRWTLERNKADVQAFIDKFAPVSDFFLLDTGKKPVGTPEESNDWKLADSVVKNDANIKAIVDGSLGATGATHDWNIDKYIVDNAPGVKVIIAGGLHAGNVADAIAVSHPFGVDTFTKTSYPKGTVGPDGTGKDPEKLRAFVEAVKNA